MNNLLILLSGCFILLGIAGSFLPIIPGPITAWIGILILSFVPNIPINFTFLILSFCIALAIFILDYFIPSLGAKKFGGGKGSVYGSSIGLIFGLLFLGPFGLILGPFLGALIGELIINKENKKGALKAAFGAFLGFFSGVFIKFLTGLAFGLFYIKSLWNIRDLLF
tara:strand:+ start:198 stop:698 length:501 start_codon:yes stop_codon:yes gene_type:complete